MPTPHPASYRDPSGFVFERNGELFRQVNPSFRQHFDHFIQSGCYDHFVKNKWIIAHEIADAAPANGAYLVIKPERIAFISYPWEWCFGSLKDAALLTLRLARTAMDFGLMIKDATPFNVQFHHGRMTFIDTLSFEIYDETKPWIAYRQFCEMFLGPLLLMHYKRSPLQQLMLAWPEGIPLSLTARFLPWRSKFSFFTYLHIHLHNRIDRKQRQPAGRTAPFSKKKMQNLLNSLEQLVASLRLPAAKTAWSDYYDEASLRNDYVPQKKAIIESWLKQLPSVRSAMDAGANTGEFSKILASHQIQTISTDQDPYCIEALYRKLKPDQQALITPLIIDLSNPSPATGLNNAERSSFLSRAKTDLVLALALVHHLAIGKNIPLEKMAALFSGLSKYLLIEFVPREDEKVQSMLQTKKDIYDSYTEPAFISAFEKHFRIIERKAIPGSQRTMFLMTAHAE